MNIFIYILDYELGGNVKLTDSYGNIPIEYFMDLSPNYKDILVGLSSPRSSLLRIDRGIRLNITPISHMALCMIVLPMKQRIEKLSESFSFRVSLF